MSVRRSGSNLIDRSRDRVERLPHHLNTSSVNTSPKRHQMWVLHATWVANAQLESTLGSACTICSTGSPTCTPWKPSQICPTQQVHHQVTRKNQSIWEGLTSAITSKILKKRSRTKFFTNSNLTHCVSTHFTKVPKNKDLAAPTTTITEALAIRFTINISKESMNRIRKVYSFASQTIKRACTDRSNSECSTQRIFLTWKLSKSLVSPWSRQSKSIWQAASKLPKSSSAGRARTVQKTLKLSLLRKRWISKMRILAVKTPTIYMDSKLYPWWKLLLEKLKQVSFWTTLFRTKNYWVKTMAAFAKSIWVSVTRSEKLSPSFFTNARPRKKN